MSSITKVSTQSGPRIDGHIGSFADHQISDLCTLTNPRQNPSKSLKFDRGEMNPLDIFCIGGSEFVFHLDGETNRDGSHRICMFHILHILLENDETQQRYTFRLL